jgi:hypothetical protein
VKALVWYCLRHKLPVRLWSRLPMVAHTTHMLIGLRELLRLTSRQNHLQEPWMMCCVIPSS